MSQPNYLMLEFDPKSEILKTLDKTRNELKTFHYSFNDEQKIYPHYRVKRIGWKTGKVTFEHVEQKD